MKKINIGYWALTALVLLPAAGSGIPELFGHGTEQSVQALTTLGYPLYLLKILGAAKILGAIAIVTNKSARLKEWAYAGFAIDFLGATASHLLARDAAHAPVPFIFFLLLMGSYALDQRRPTKQ